MSDLLVLLVLLVLLDLPDLPDLRELRDQSGLRDQPGLRDRKDLLALQARPALPALLGLRDQEACLPSVNIVAPPVRTFSPNQFNLATPGSVAEVESEETEAGLILSSNRGFIRFPFGRCFFFTSIRGSFRKDIP